MLAFNLINSFIGLTLAIFGFMIRFQGRLDLINGYKKGSVKDEESYAFWMGNSELFCGLALVFLGLIGFSTENAVFLILLDPAIILVLIVLLFAGEKKYGKIK
ncbi:MAG TPA: DUF3784 domain-containing protein [Clostridia bacterium]|nr:DUF3784 domain-containing protein [Clostridia bacterium]